MSKPTTSGPSPSATSPSANQSPAKSKPTVIIVVAVVGGILLIVALVLIIVPLARRRASRRRKKQAESSSLSDVTSTTVASRREIQNRTISVDASVPLLEPDSTSTSVPEYSRFDPLNIQTAHPDNTYTRTGSPPTPSTNASLSSPRLFAPTFSSFADRPPPFADLEPGPPPRSRFIRSAPQQPLRHTRTRIARVPMDTLPEDLPMDTPPLRSPSPTAKRSVTRAPTLALAPAPASSPSPPPSPPPPPLSHASSRTSTSTSTSATATSARAPSPPTAPPSPTNNNNWLHIPKNSSGIPLIGAFRKSISSIASRGSSLPTMQHYPSFSQSQNAYSASASGSTRSSQTFYSAPPSPPPPPVPPSPLSLHSEHGELPRPLPAPRLKPGSNGERVPQVYLGAPDEQHHAASRKASMVYGDQNQNQNAVPGTLRPGQAKSSSSTVGSDGSSLSLYADARSQIGGVGEDGRWNGSANGSVGGSSVRGRQRS